MTKSVASTPTRPVASQRELEQRVAYLGPHGLLTFATPQNATPEQLDLAHKLALLDKRAHRELGFGTPEWEAVIQLLVNGIEVGVLAGHIKQGRELLEEAYASFDFYRNLTTRNRLLYLLGVVLGAALLAAVTAIVGALLEPELSLRRLILATIFSGLGTIASVLSRLAQIEELQVEHSRVSLLISGASRPIVAALLALVLTLVLDLRIVTFNIGNPAAGDGRLYLITSFLCGFSERFAQEILAKILPRESCVP
jgi:hypothetical protein